MPTPAARRRGVEAARELLGVAQVLDALGHVERDADERDRLALGAALDDAARQHVAPAAVAAPIARLHVGRLPRRQRLLGRGEDERNVVGVDEGAHLVDRQPLRPRRHAEQLEREVAVEHASGAQVVAPDRDLAEVDRELELRVDVAQRPRRVVRLGVVHHHPEGAVGDAARAVLHFPLRVDPARLAVRVDDPVALRVAAGAPGRLGVGQARAVLRMDALDRVVVGGRAGGRVDAPEAEHVLVPAPFTRRDLALPDAQAAELLRGVEQFLLRAARAARARWRVTSASVQTMRPATRAEWTSTRTARRPRRAAAARRCLRLAS